MPIHRTSTARDTRAPAPSARRLKVADPTQLADPLVLAGLGATDGQLDAYAVSGSSPPTEVLTEPSHSPFGIVASPKVWLTLADVADELDVSVRTVLRWVQRGELPAIELPGGRKRIHCNMFDAWLASRLTTPAPTPGRG
jgi:excisionase family DNA binding protein